jgi:hypothetical protein
MKTQKQLNALDRARTSQSMLNYRQIIQGLTEKGIDPKDIALRENVLTFDAWRATGRTVRRGEKGIRCLTWIPMPDDTGAKTVRPRSVYVFHISQTENLA